MIEMSGSFLQRPGFPYIYFIVVGRFLYIGETQRLPVVRWGEHFSPNGSFTKALEKRAPDFECSTRPSLLTAFCCERIGRDLLSSERKLATQWVEHDLHMKACSNAEIGSSFTLISDTIRTAPPFKKYNWLSVVSLDIFNRFRDELSRQHSLH